MRLLEFRNRASALLVAGVCVGSLACRESHSSSTTLPDPPAPTPSSPLPSAPPSPALPPLASCGALPNYFNPGGPFTRWERFPLRLSIDSASLPFAPSELFVAYVKGIREGAVVWSLASGEAFGILSEVGSNLQNADITVRVDQPVGEALLFGTEGEVELLQLDSARIIRRARILLYPSNFPPLSPPELQAYVANIVGHEMGHAFGVLQHSTDPSDLMFGSRNQKRASYPWITVRDLNTMSEAYCR